MEENLISSSDFKDVKHKNKPSILSNETKSKEDIITSTKINSIYDTYLNEKNNKFRIKLLIAAQHQIHKEIISKNETSIFSVFQVLFKKEERDIDWFIVKSKRNIIDFLNVLINDEDFRELPNLTQKLVRKLLKEDNLNFEEFGALFNKVECSSSSIKIKIYFLEFLEISILSFSTINDGIKYKEGYVVKHSRPVNSGCCKFIFCGGLGCKVFVKKWFICKNDMIFYIDSSWNYLGKDIFWYDQDVLIKTEISTLQISNLRRELIMKFETDKHQDLWVDMISTKICDFKQRNNKYSSFAPNRDHCHVKVFVEGEEYFAHLAKKLLSAKATIFIAGWWISPELYLIRPVEKGNETSMLKNILLTKAKEGVKIYILVYKEVAIALNLDSNYTKKSFNDLHENIKVTRYPKKLGLWSNHEKIVIIDQNHGYLGGIDLCWGRFDTSQHALFEHKTDDEQKLFWPGIDYSNPRIKDFESIQDYSSEAVSRDKPRMPWHDVHCYVEGQISIDLSKHFIERWNYARSDNSRLNADSNTIVDVKSDIDEEETISSKLLDLPSHGFSKGKNTNYFEISNSDQNSESHANNNIESHSHDEKIKEYALQYNNFRNSLNKANFNNLPKLNTNLKFKRDIMFENNNSFIDIKETPTEKNLFKRLNSVFQMTKGFAFSVFNGDTHDTALREINLLNDLKSNKRKEMSCQLVRSAAEWSTGILRDENSILKAYYDLIDNSENYIYIENQFFISRAHENSSEGVYNFDNEVNNEIALRLRDRIIKAINQNKKFHVIVIIPLIPGFEGDIADSVTVQTIIKYTYKTISRGKGFSLLESLFKVCNEKVKDYIYFFSLRTHGVNPYTKLPETEQIYIHAKIMIIDDKVAIIGSANINDRSMLGFRDSEVCIIVRDKTIKVNNRQISPFCFNLRIKLMQEHLGIDYCTEIDENNFLFDFEQCFIRFKNTAINNTTLYSQIFPDIYPSDSQKKLEDICKIVYENEDEIAKLVISYEGLKNDIKGNLVEFPLFFLDEENLDRPVICKERLVPLKNFL